MEVKLMIQSTPNPNALKFVLSVPVKTEGNITYKNAQECEHNPMAEAVFGTSSNIAEVYFFDNYVTVTQNGQDDWDDLEEKVKKVVMEHAAAHDPNFKFVEAKSEAPTQAKSNPDIDRINTILDETVRPALQMDGGDIQIVDYENNVVKVFYQGACGSCPSAATGTMKAIENILRDSFNPEVMVEIADTL